MGEGGGWGWRRVGTDAKSTSSFSIIFLFFLLFSIFSIIFYFFIIFYVSLFFLFLALPGMSRLSKKGNLQRSQKIEGSLEIGK